ncbi:hypothetical protein FKX85_02520 [Echinicola soli]|uniref:DUF4221 domain-containing protein n=1 Tax=Echinicola soli TaxID=2591634 RepID=A0A514CDS8_9BACT|nr:hypothetical protein [Echinicola soli]QDH77968.1 hypothetical protein FKX85_02520 [Echinicola soli]
MIRLFFVVLVTVFLIACNKTSDKTNSHKDYALEIVDSIRIDYLGNFILVDYSPERNEYLARGHGDWEFLFFDTKGNVMDSVSLKKDGPDAITWAQAVGFVDGRLGLLEPVKGLLAFGDEGDIVDRTKIPGDYYYLNGFAGKPYFKLGDELIYYRPERGEISHDDRGGMMRGIYQRPILEVQDSVTGEISSTMPFPATSKYRDGKYYGWMFPTVIKKGKVWLLYFNGEYQFYIYEEKNGELHLKRTVEMDVPDGIRLRGVPFDKADRFEEVNRSIRGGGIKEVIFFGEMILAVYSKGMDEEETSLFDFETLEGRMAAFRADDKFVQVFDIEGQLLADIPCPEGMLLGNVINQKGQWVTTKDQAYFGQEEDWQTLYLIELVEE